MEHQACVSSGRQEVPPQEPTTEKEDGGTERHL